MADDSMTLLDTLRKVGADGDVDLLREGVRVLAEAIMEAEVGELAIRMVFEQPDGRAAREQLDRVIDGLRPRFGAVAELLTEAEPDTGNLERRPGAVELAVGADDLRAFGHLDRDLSDSSSSTSSSYCQTCSTAAFSGGYTMSFMLVAPFLRAQAGHDHEVGWHCQGPDVDLQAVEGRVGAGRGLAADLDGD